MGDGPADLARSTAEGVGGYHLLFFASFAVMKLKEKSIRRPRQRSSMLDLLDRLPSLGPCSLKETACRHEGCSLLAVGLKVLV